jgi:RNA-directed DNA polymerase
MRWRREILSPVSWMGCLRLVLNGFYNYYAVPTNFRALNAFYYPVLWHWLRCLRRRSQRHNLTWRKMMRIAGRWLPSPNLRHPHPDWRFDVNDPRQEPGAVVPLAGIYAGGGE